jgi:hypothetical protein
MAIRQRARTAAPKWGRIWFAGLCLFALVISGCGKSERQKREEKAADDARWDAAVAAAEAERQKDEQQLTAREVARLSGNDAKLPPTKSAASASAPNPAVRPSGWAVMSGNVTKQNMDDAEAAALESIRVATLPRWKEQQLSGWDKFLPGGTSSTPVFRDAHWNVAQTAICGEVDIEWSPPDGGKRTRSGFRKFVLGSPTPQTIAYGRKGSNTSFFAGIDIEGRSYHWFKEHYDQVMAVTDCTPDLEH